MDQRSIANQIKLHGKLDGSLSHAVAGIIWADVKAYGKFWEKDGKKSEREKADKEIAKLKEQIEILKAEKTAVRNEEELTKEQVVAMIRESAGQGNAASQKILSEYIGLGKHEEDMTIEMVDFSDAPDWYKTKKPE